MSRALGVTWHYDPRASHLIARQEDGTERVIGFVYAGRDLYGVQDPGVGQANGRLMASARETLTALHGLLDAAAPHLGEDHPEVVRARELLAEMVAESLR